MAVVLYENIGGRFFDFRLVNITFQTFNKTKQIIINNKRDANKKKISYLCTRLLTKTN